MEGLAEIEIQGAEDPALTIRFNTLLLERYGFDSSRIMSQINDRLNWRSSGFADQGHARLSMLIPPQFDSVEEIRQMKISIPNSSRQIYLGDIASVEIEDYPVKSLKRLNGKPALTLFFIRESGSDAMGLAENVRRDRFRLARQLSH